MHEEVEMEEEEEEGKFKKSEIGSRTLDPAKTARRAPDSSHSQLAADAAQVYRRITGLSPNQPQRVSIAGAVTDLLLWQSTVEHWMSHGWNPRNLPALLDFYARGGPPACQSCQKSPSPGARPSPRDATLAALEEVRKELFGGKS